MLPCRDISILVCRVRDGISLAIVTDVREGALGHFSSLVGFRTDELQLARLPGLGSISAFIPAEVCTVQ
jgi:hypothetical protein